MVTEDYQTDDEKKTNFQMWKYQTHSLVEINQLQQHTAYLLYKELALSTQ